MKLTPKKIYYSTDSNTCKNCEHVFKGKICNQCGEKTFNEKHLATGHFLHEVIDFFYHFENKVLKTLKLNILKPGFITKENLRGVRIPYAKPVQLYLVVAFAFYLIIGKLGITDYIPSYQDHNYFLLSDYKLFGWAKPVDDASITSIDNMWVKKGEQIQNKIENNLAENLSSPTDIILKGRNDADSIILPASKISVIAFNQAQTIQFKLFNKSIGTYAKTLIFLLIPIFAGFFYIIFYKKIKYYGAALIFATHFMIYNLCFYTITSVLNYSPKFFAEKFVFWMMMPFQYLFFNHTIAPISSVIFGSGFEFFHLMFWMPWLYLAFRRLFQTVWWKNLFLSYLCTRIFFYLTFGVFKKALIAFTIWMLPT